MLSPRHPLAHLLVSASKNVDPHDVIVKDVSQFRFMAEAKKAFLASRIARNGRSDDVIDGRLSGRKETRRQTRGRETRTQGRKRPCPRVGRALILRDRAVTHGHATAAATSAVNVAGSGTMPVLRGKESIPAYVTPKFMHARHASQRVGSSDVDFTHARAVPDSITAAAAAARRSLDRFTMKYRGGPLLTGAVLRVYVVFYGTLWRARERSTIERFIASFDSAASGTVKLWWQITTDGYKDGQGRSISDKARPVLCTAVDWLCELRVVQLMPCRHCSIACVVVYHMS